MPTLQPFKATQHSAQVCSCEQVEPSCRVVGVSIVVWHQLVPSDIGEGLGLTATVFGKFVAWVYVQVWAK